MLKIAVNNLTVKKPKKIHYCPKCNGSVWLFVNYGLAERPSRKRCCVHCLSKGKESYF